VVYEEFRRWHCDGILLLGDLDGTGGTIAGTRIQAAIAYIYGMTSNPYRLRRFVSHMTIVALVPLGAMIFLISFIILTVYPDKAGPPPQRTDILG
jgi:hypothetical protein